MAQIDTQRADIRALKGVHLFHNYMSNCSQRVALALSEKGVVFESHHIDLQKHENLTPEFRALNPNAVVPVLVHDGRTIIESNDIIRYIDDSFPGPTLWPASEPDILVATDFMKRSADLQNTLKWLTYEFLMKPIARKSAKETQKTRRAAQIPGDAIRLAEFLSPTGLSKESIAADVTALAKAFAYLENRLSEADYLGGDEYGLADISWLPNVRRAALMNYPLDRHPQLAVWYRDLSNTARFRQSITRFEPLGPLTFIRVYTWYRVLTRTDISSVED